MGPLLAIFAVAGTLHWTNPSVTCPDTGSLPPPLHDLSAVKAFGTARWSRDTVFLGSKSVAGREGKADSMKVSWSEPLSVWTASFDILGRPSCSPSNFVWLGPAVAGVPPEPASFWARGGAQLSATWAAAGPVRLEVLDVAGRELYRQDGPATGSAHWSGRQGVYFTRLTFPGGERSRLFIISR